MSLLRTKQGLVFHLTLLALSIVPLWSTEITPQQRDFFENKIRPVLAQECYECHNSRGKSKGKLILDHRTALRKGGSSGQVIVPGNASESLLVQAIRHDFDDLEMPKAGVLLDAPIIADFVKWVNMGAPDPRDAPPTAEELKKDTDWDAVLKTRKNWWSFQPVKNPPIPAASKWSDQPIDLFIEAKLKEKELNPNPPAEPAVLVRRLYYALTGLPPSPEELTSAIRDPNSAIETLLASPHFGEKWARHWMDWIRYAESHGSEGDPRIDNAYLYRDYLIRALNEDVPYDQLVKEHIAGDLLDTPRINNKLGINESVLGAVHWRMVFHGFAPTDALDEKVRFTDDQINVFTKAFQALTVSCARCHDHKFDAISQADYYAMFGVLGSTRPGRKLVDLPDALEKNKATLTKLKPKIRVALAKDWEDALASIPRQLVEEKIKALFPITKTEKTIAATWKNKHLIWMGDRQRRDSWKKIHAVKKWNFTSAADYQNWFRYGNGLPDKPAKAGDFSVATDGKYAIADILPAGVYPHLLSNKHAARFTSPDFQLDGEYELYLNVIGGGSASLRYVVENYPRSGTVYPVTVFDGKKVLPNWRWQRYDLSYWKGDNVHIELADAKDAPLLVKKVDRSWFGIREVMLVKKGSEAPGGNTLETLDPLFAGAADKKPTSLKEIETIYIDSLRRSIRQWAGGRISDSTALQLNRAVEEGILPNELVKLKQTAPLLRQYIKAESEIVSPTRVPGLDEWTGHDQALFERGDHKKPGTPIPRRFLDAIDPTPWNTTKSGRLELAGHLLATDNPFTRRVIVNRVWAHLFGKGIVPTADNFGRLGESPTHPDLLDHLATKFSDQQHWSIKELVREIVKSQTWQQSSLPSEMAKENDPGNVWLSHFSVNRLEAEAVRDSLLSAAGSLDRSLFGPPVGGSTARRSVYVNILRNRLDPFLSIYDAPVPFSATGHRAVTNVPAQSLTMLNDPFVLNAAKQFAASFENEKDKAQRIEKMWLKALGRKPLDTEKRAAMKLAQDLQEKGKVIAAKRSALEQELDLIDQDRKAMLSAVRSKLARNFPENPVSLPDLKPVARWRFEGNGKDEIGSADLSMQGSARIENGMLLVDGKGFALTQDLGFDLKEKSLEVRVMLDTHDQRAGGVMTVQDTKGIVFDAIVYAERRPARWLAGSDRFTRTSDFDGTDERDEMVHLVITYDADGTIRCFRNGAPYGKAYLSKGPANFRKGQSQILFGLRHGSGIGGNRMFRGRILEASLYNRALTATEIQAAANSGGNFVSNTDVLDSLGKKGSDQLRRWDEKIESLKIQLEKTGQPVGEPEIWENLAHSIFNLKEFIYVY